MDTVRIFRFMFDIFCTRVHLMDLIYSSVPKSVIFHSHYPQPAFPNVCSSTIHCFHVPAFPQSSILSLHRFHQSSIFSVHICSGQVHHSHILPSFPLLQSITLTVPHFFSPLLPPVPNSPQSIILPFPQSPLVH